MSNIVQDILQGKLADAQLKIVDVLNALISERIEAEKINVGADAFEEPIEEANSVNTARIKYLHHQKESDYRNKLADKEEMRGKNYGVRPGMEKIHVDNIKKDRHKAMRHRQAAKAAFKIADKR